MPIKDRLVHTSSSNILFCVARPYQVVVRIYKTAWRRHRNRRVVIPAGVMVASGGGRELVRSQGLRYPLILSVIYDDLGQPCQSCR